jgi:prepilin-type N-terminal cleavage/methylation domain-containing protein
MNAISHWEEVPIFDREEAEAAYWAENRIDVRLMESSVAAGAELADSTTITLRMDPRMLARIKRLARSRYLNYQSMIKQWLSERMEQEMREQKLGARSQNGFTLIELLAVISIMGIIAALVISMNSAAAAAKRRGMVDAEKNRLMAAIDTYQLKLNFYPPDNGALATTNGANYDRTAAVNPLLYELTGGVITNNGTAYEVKYENGGTIPLNGFSTVFNRGGIANSDPTSPQNFFIPLPQPSDYTNYNSANPTICGLLVPVALTNGQLNFWHYDSSSPNRHNPNSYDLWAEYSIGTKNGQLTIITNGNW